MDVVELTMFETHDKVQSYILDSPDRVVMATWGKSVSQSVNPWKATPLHACIHTGGGSISVCTYASAR